MSNVAKRESLVAQYQHYDGFDLLYSFLHPTSVQVYFMKRMRVITSYACMSRLRWRVGEQTFYIT